MGFEMSLELRSILEAGVFLKERLTLRVTSEGDVGDYAILQCRFVDNTLTTDVLRAFWFPYGAVEKGDLVVLYTKAGTRRQKTLENGSQAHFFYWGESYPIWDEEDVAPVLLHAPKWTSLLRPEHQSGSPVTRPRASNRT